MKTIAFASAWLLTLGLVCSASAAESAIDELGTVQPGLVPVPAAAAAAAAGQAAPDIDIFSYFGYAKTPRPAPLFQEKGISQPVFSITLETIRNAYLKPSVTFTTGAGTVVHVSGTKASNCPDGGNSCKDKEKFFLVLTTDKNQSYFVRAVEILNWGFLYSGSKTVTIDGESYVVKIYANASTPADSKIEVKGPRGVALNSTLQAVGDAVAQKGVDVTLSKIYKLAYGNEIVQGPQGAKFTDKMLVLMLPFPVVDASSYFILNASDIKPAGAAYPSFEDRYGFMLQGGVLNIYTL